MPFPTLQTWFGKKAFRRAPPPPKDRSQVRVGIPKVLNIWSTHQFWVGFLREIGIESENIVFSSDTSEEQGREFGKGRGTVDCCYPVKSMSGHYGELVFGQKKKINVHSEPHDLFAAFRSARARRRNADLHARDGRPGKYQGRIHEGKRRLRGQRNQVCLSVCESWPTGHGDQANVRLL